MIRLFATDMDGTFVDRNRQFNRQRLAKVLTRLKAARSYFVVASGNQHALLQQYFHGLPVNQYVAENGAYATSFDQVIVCAAFPTALMQTILKFLQNDRRYGITMCTPEMAYLRRTEDPGLITAMKSYNPKLTLVDNLLPYAQQVVKLSLNIPKDQTQTMLHDLQSRFGQQLTATSSGFGNIDVILPGRDKAYGLSKLGAHLGISMAQMCTFGDGGNDISMLKAAGRGVAMANATLAVKAAADALTLSNNEDGVLMYIEQVLTAQGQ